MKFPEVTAHAVLLDETRTKILLIKWKNPLGQRVWAFPGGHIEFGEKVKDTVVREVKEETGYEIKADKLLGVYDNIIKDASSEKVLAHYVNVVWMAKIVSGSLNCSGDKEILDAEWFPFAKAKILKMSPNGRRILNDVLSVIACEDEEMAGLSCSQVVHN